MKNSEYYKNRSITELTKIFADICTKKSLEQTTERFTNWLNAEHTTTTLVPGDVIIQDLHGSKVDVVISIDDACGSIKLRPLACVLNDNNANRDQNVSISYLTLFTGKPICNINDLQKDPTGIYNFTAKPSCPLSKSSKLSDLTPTPKANKSKKDKILDYMEKVMLIKSRYIDELRKWSVKEIYEKSQYLNSAYIFSVLYRVSPHMCATLSDEFMHVCHCLAPKWYAVRKKCEGFKYLNNYELTAMLDFRVVGYTGTNREMYNINGEIVSHRNNSYQSSRFSI